MATQQRYERYRAILTSQKTNHQTSDGLIARLQSVSIRANAKILPTLVTTFLLHKGFSMPDLSIRVAFDVLAEVEEILEERKTPDRRKRQDSSNPFSHPDKDRRSGKDRRQRV